MPFKRYKVGNITAYYNRDKDNIIHIYINDQGFSLLKDRTSNKPDIFYVKNMVQAYIDGKLTHCRV